MKEFWETAEKLFLKRGEATMYTTDDLDMFVAILKKAAAKTDPKTVYGQRVRLIQKEIAPYFKTMYQLRSRGKFMTFPFVKDEIPLEFDRNGVWKHAMEYTLTYKDGRTNISPVNATKVYALANEKGMALHIVAGEPNLAKMVSKTTKHDETDKSWMDDCYELFLSTADRKENRQYIITVGGKVSDGKRGIDVNVCDWDWNSKLKLKQTRGQGGTKQMGKGVHTTTVFIPWSDLGFKFTDLPQLLIQLYRRQTNGNPKNGIYYLLFPSMGFHNYSPEYFGPVKFIRTENRLENGDFSELNEKGLPVSWNGKGSISADRKDGEKPSWKLAGAKGKGDQGLSSRKFLVEPDTDYTLSLRHYGDCLWVYTLFYGKDGKNIPDPARKFFWVASSKEWETVVFQGRVPAGAVQCLVFLRNFESSKKIGGAFAGSVEFNGGLKFMKPVPEFKNGSFEELGKDGKPVGWSRPCNLENSSAADGRTSIRVAVKNHDWLQTDKFPVKGGKAFQLKLKHKGSFGYVYLLYYDKNNKKVEPTWMKGVGGSKSWTSQTFNGIFPANASKCSIGLRNFQADFDNGTWFDALELFSE